MLKFTQKEARIQKQYRYAKMNAKLFQKLPEPETTKRIELAFEPAIVMQ